MGRAHFVAVRYGSEASTLVVPRKPLASKRLVIYAHGAFGDPKEVCDALNHPSLVAHINAWADAGLYVLAGDFAGQQTFGNDAMLTQFEAAVAWGWANLPVATDKVALTGASMGADSVLRYAAEHPTLVAGISCFMPGIDVEDLRTRDALGVRAGMNTSWGLPVGSYIGGADQTPVPTRGKPMDSSNTATVASIPTHFWYSTADTVAVSSSIDTYAASRANVTKHVVSTSLGHVDATIGAAPTADVRDLLLSFA